MGTRAPEKRAMKPKPETDGLRTPKTRRAENPGRKGNLLPKPYQGSFLETRPGSPVTSLIRSSFEFGGFRSTVKWLAAEFSGSGEGLNLGLRFEAQRFV